MIRMLNLTWLTVLAFPLATAQAQNQPPIIDMHMHARMTVLRAADGSVVPRPCDPQPCSVPATPSTTDGAPLRGTLAAMDRHNIVLGFLSDDYAAVDAWMEAAPDRFLPSTAIPPDITTGALPDIDSLRHGYETGRFEALGEVAMQYFGFAPNDPRLRPYFALAQELDLPVLIHSGGLGAHTPRFHVSNGRPVLLEEVVTAFPRLRIYVENAAYPFLDEMIALMTQHPQVYADVSTITWILPRSAFYRYLKALVDAGLGKRIMFGSDQMNWPETIDIAVDAIESAPFLSAEQKRDIFYNNAARFLRLSERE